MKAISLTQPWASLMEIQAKRNETRSWPSAYKGDLAICASKEVWRNRVPEYAFPALQILWQFRGEFSHYAGNVQELYLGLPFGKVVCVVEKYDCIATSDDNGDDRSLTGQELELGDYSPGRFYYPTRNCRRLNEPVAVKGEQGLFILPPEVVEKIQRQLAARTE